MGAVNLISVKQTGGANLYLTRRASMTVHVRRECILPFLTFVSGGHAYKKSIFFRGIRERSAPMTLLVHKEEESTNLGVDMSRWRFGSKDLLIFKQEDRRYSDALRTERCLLILS